MIKIVFIASNAGGYFRMEKHNSFKSKISSKTIELEDPNEILFPKMCLICGQTTGSKFKKKVYGSFTNRKSYKNNYNFSLPICISCQRKMKIKTGITTKYGIPILISMIIGLIFSGIIIYYISSYIMGLSVATLLITISIIYYLRKTMEKIKLDDYLKINIKQDVKDTIILTFRNNEYSQFIERIN